MSAGIIHGQRVTGYRVVRPFLARLGTFVDEPVVVDSELCRHAAAAGKVVAAICYGPPGAGRRTMIALRPCSTA